MASWGSYKVEQLHHEWEAEEELVEEEQKRLEELMRLYGLEEKEARAAYHLGLAEELFEELSEEPTAGVGSRPFEGSMRRCTMRWTSASTSRRSETSLHEGCSNVTTLRDGV